MTTVTGLTAARMLQIEAASVVDGDVIGGNLILTKHDGSTINAGPVTGPQGPQGPIGQDLSVLSAVPVLDIGTPNQLRAGRQLTVQDFTNLGLSAPIALWNLSDLTDSSGNARTLINKGAVPFAPGINGAANTSAQFTGSVAQVLYISDTGANDPFRIKVGTMGFWLKCSKRNYGGGQRLFAKLTVGGAATDYNFDFNIGANSLIAFNAYCGSTLYGVASTRDVCDDYWHFVVVTADGTALRMYYDGMQDASSNIPSPITPTNFGPLNIGGFGGDGSNATQQPYFGRMDEVFITNDVLSEDEIRNLYCAKIVHTLPTTPIRASLSVRRRRKGAALTAADFPTQPLRLYNFSSGSLGDEGSQNVSLTNNGNPINVSGADGSTGNAFSFAGSPQSLSATDAGLPTAQAPCSLGCWFKTTYGSPSYMVDYGQDCGFGLQTGGLLITTDGATNMTSVFVADGLWHFGVFVLNNAAVDGLKEKMYLDGRVVSVLTTFPSIPLKGANSFRVGSLAAGISNFVGQVDGVFVCGYALTTDQILALYAKGAQSLGISPKNSGDHIEAIRANDLLVTFDTLDSQHQIDLAVA